MAQRKKKWQNGNIRKSIFIYCIVGLILLFILLVLNPNNIINRSKIIYSQITSWYTWRNLTFNNMNIERESYVSTLKKAVKEVSTNSHYTADYNMTGCYHIAFYAANEESCEFGVWLYFSDPENQNAYEKKLIDQGWQDKTARTSMLPDPFSSFFKKIDGRPVCLIMGKGQQQFDTGEHTNALGVHIDLVDCPKPPALSDAWDGWEIYVPTEIPSRYSFKRKSLSRELTLYYTQRQGVDSSLPYIEVEEGKLPKEFSPPNCVFSFFGMDVSPCTFTMKTNKNINIYLDDRYNEDIERVYYFSIDKTYFIIRLWHNTPDHKALTNEELVRFVDSFKPQTLTELQTNFIDTM